MSYWRIYLTAVLEDWVARMAGAVGLSFTIASFFVGPNVIRPLFLVLAMAALQYAAFRVWKAERRESEKLARRLEPRLEFEYEPGEKPFFEDTEQAVPPGAVWTTHWIRVGVRNRSGTAVDRVSVVLEKCQPSASQGVHLEHAFWPQGCPPGTAEFLVPAGGRVIVNLANSTRFTPPAGASHPSGFGPLNLTYAASVRNELDDNAPEYCLRLRAQGEGTPPAFCSFIVRPNFVHRAGDFQALPEWTAREIETS